MDRKEKKVLKREEKLQRKYQKVADGGKFKQWRNKRPFWGATLTVLTGLLILYIPLHLYAIAFIPGSLVFVGFLFGGLILIDGIFAFIYPQFSTVFGVVTMFLSILSIMGALGGFIIGTILGLIAGSLCIAWEKEEVIMNHKQNKKQNRTKKKSKNSGESENIKAAQA
ncbi:hypothetical protein GCM10011409_13500 [Lentibacillus populi]|uniref:Uncharacterized protein n=1 Tax=Lentibacillus populi TaxID=1827502 RepID=A0A9W5X4P4_9BACI|nr:DUF6114 domain-containing protein [Lentibacillus populi]MBT2218121.1 hypothetical protein [Virgibacillus dakarensis]GGB37379.1 hypothetical protein GCM10011409_13500 [Lentibacillus populi]